MNTNNKILVLEDSNERIERFRNHFQKTPFEVTFISTAQEAINQLVQSEFLVVYLDHDLGENAGNGMDVVDFMVNNNIKPGVVFVHSMNVIAAPRMVQTLKNSGVPAYSTSFSSIQWKN